MADPKKPGFFAKLFHKSPSVERLPPVTDGKPALLPEAESALPLPGNPMELQIPEFKETLPAKPHATWLQKLNPFKGKHHEAEQPLPAEAAANTPARLPDKVPAKENLVQKAGHAVKAIPKAADKAVMAGFEGAGGVVGAFDAAQIKTSAHLAHGRETVINKAMDEDPIAKKYREKNPPQKTDSFVEGLINGSLERFKIPLAIKVTGSAAPEAQPAPAAPPAPTAVAVPSPLPPIAPGELPPAQLTPMAKPAEIMATKPTGPVR